MDIKKEVLNRIEKFLNSELTKCNDAIHINKRNFEKLTNEQTILKRERVKITELINFLYKDK